MTSSALHASSWIEVEPFLAAPFGLAVALGVILWYAFFFTMVQRIRGRISVDLLPRIIRIMGIFVFAIGFWFLFSVLR